jgi:hypothetical protein
VEQFFEIYTASGGLHTWITTTSFLSIAVALLLFFGVARFYQKMSISFFFPLFCIIALLCATFEIGSKVTIGSFSLKRLLLLITGISLLWFLFHINYSLFKRNWDGAFYRQSWTGYPVGVFGLPLQYGSGSSQYVAESHFPQFWNLADRSGLVKKH